MIQATARLRAAGGVRALAFDASEPLQLASGEFLAPLTIAFETYGALNAERANAVLVCHGLNADQFVASPNPVSGRPAWWPRIVGPGRPIDTNRFFIICANVLGGSMGTTGPATPAPDGAPYGLRFPAIDVADMVSAQAKLVEAFGVSSLFLAIGAGEGAMQALQWASAFPKRVFACATIAGAVRQSAHTMAAMELARQAIMADPDWRGGAYQAAGTRPTKGLAVARMAALASHDADSAFRRAQHARSGFAADADLQVAAYLRRRGQEAPDRFDANSFLYLTRAFDRFDLAADFGGALANAFRDSATRHCVIAFSSDRHHPPHESRAIARALVGAGADAAYVELDTVHGHDSFLLEEPTFETALTGFIDAAAAARGLALHGGPDHGGGE